MSTVLRPHNERWTIERIGKLGRSEVTQLRTNAAGLGQVQVVALCDEVLLSAAKDPGDGMARRLKASGVRLVSRRSAFETRGVTLQSLSSWGGIRHSDGMVVMSIWKDGIRSEGGECSYLLWAPNEKGARPWSDKPAGQERLEHCKKACERGAAEALLVYGQSIEGRLPEEKAKTISGVDAAIVLQIAVVLRGKEYWAVWGGRRTT
jgi:hypothetical protein